MSERQKILWISRFCMADTSSGAAITTRAILSELSYRGFDVLVLGMSVFDHERGQSLIGDALAQAEPNRHGLVTISDGVLKHNLVRTVKTKADLATSQELDALYRMYIKALEEFRPDLVWYFGGSSFDMLIPDEAKRLGIPSMAFVYNGNYQNSRWSRDVDLLLTETRATAEMYAETSGLNIEAIDTFIQPEAFVAPERTPQHVTFVNPTLEKGGAIVAQLALALEETRPDITFEVVESRGTWQPVLDLVTETMDLRKRSLKNVIVTPHTRDMRPIYARSRVILMPSLWWEAMGRVLVEGMMNGIPSIVTNQGGPPITAAEACVKLNLPKLYYTQPYNRLLPPEAVTQVASAIIPFFDDPAYYEAACARARAVAARDHNIGKNADRLAARLRTFLEARGQNNVPAA